MPKKIKIPAKRADRNVRWTLEVSADSRTAATEGLGAPGKRKATARRNTPGTSARRLTGSRDRKPAAKKKTLRKQTSRPASATTPLDPHVPVRLRPSVLAMAAGAVVVVVALVLMRDTSVRASAAAKGDSEVAASGDLPAVQPAVSAPLSPRVAPTVAVAAPSRAQAPPPVAAKPTGTDVAPRPSSVPANSAPLRPAPVATLVRAEEPVAAPAAVATSMPPMDSNLTADRVGQAPITITGCLEMTTDGGQFRLTDTDGDGAPRARGWRSGFLRKRPAAVELSELSDPASARRYVGHRVVATGILASRELRVRSLQSAGSVCR